MFCRLGTLSAVTGRPSAGPATPRWTLEWPLRQRDSAGEGALLTGAAGAGAEPSQLSLVYMVNRPLFNLFIYWLSHKLPLLKGEAT